MTGSIKERELYGLLWEVFNKAKNLNELRASYSQLLEGKTLENEEIFISMFARFFNVHNIFLETPEKGLFSLLLISKIYDNAFVTVLARDILSKKNFVIEDENNENLRVINKENLEYLNHSVDFLPIEKSQKGKLVSASIFKALKLNKHHKLTLVDGQIHIELVIEKSSKELDLEFIYEKEPPEFYENSFSDIVVDVLKNQLNLSSIDNMFFHTHYKNIFISEIKKIIEPLYNSKETLLDPFCEFLFNKYQDYILLDIGEKIMILILGKVPNIAKFINFYNGNPTSINGQTIEKPNITYLENVYTYNSILSALNNRQNFITKHNIEKLERGDFLLERMKKSLLGLIEKREELDKQKVEETSKEYQDLLFDIDITERDIINRENRKKKVDEENASLKEEYQQLNEQKEDIKKALISAIKSFDELLK